MSEHLDFMPVTSVTPDNNSVTIQEYLGAEVTDQGRQRDMIENPHMNTYHSFAFDYVYGP
jgi:hypothetical protein